MAGDYQNLTQELLHRGVSRRHVMRLLGTTAGLVGVSGTSAASAAWSSQPPHLTLQDGEDDRPELIVGVQGLPANIDPPQSASNVSNRVLYSVFDWLIDTSFVAGDPPGTGNELVPMLATDWTRVDDTTFELQLRDGVLFHNDTPMTANDVKFTFDRMIGENAPAEFAYARSAISSISGVEVVDERTMRILTNAPDPVLESRLSAWPDFIVPQAYVEEVGLEGFGRAPIGTGPYRVLELAPDDQLVLEAFDDYWGERPPISRLTFRVIPETATRITSVITNEVQIATNVPPDQVPALQSESSVNLQQIPLANYHVLIYRTYSGVMGNKLLRQALNLGVDRQLLIDTLWGGDAIPTHGPQIEAWGKLYNPDRPLMQYDPDRAQQLIAESGYDGELITFRAHPTYYTLGLQAAQAIVQMWENIGLNTELVAREDIWGDPEEIMVAHWSNGLFPYDPDTTFWSAWGPNGRPQQEWWTPENPRYNELGNAARQTLDQQSRYEMYQQAIDIWEEEAPGTVLYIPVENYASQNNVEWTPYAVYSMDLRAENLSVGDE